MRLFALSDLHVDHALNLEALKALLPHPQDWVLVGGDLAESLARTEEALRVFVERFARVFWVPGNHDLWTTRRAGAQEPRGEAKYRALVALCRRLGVVTPEEPYELFPGSERPLRIAPLFLLYDYSFAPDGRTPEEARAWAAEDGIVCTDEHLLFTEPHPSKEAWCATRLAETEPRLRRAAEDAELIILNHFPLRRDTVFIPRVPRFVPWCGTRATEGWHRPFRARAIVTGQRHVPRRRVIDGVPFYDVSVGYPRDWNPAGGLAAKLVQVA